MLCTVCRNCPPKLQGPLQSTTKSTLFGFMALLRMYHPRLILVCHIPTNGDRRTVCYTHRRHLQRALEAIFPCPVNFGFPTIGHGSTEASNAVAVDALPVESTPQAKPLAYTVKFLKGLRIKPHKVSVPVPHRIRLLGVHGVEERVRPDMLRDETG